MAGKPKKAPSQFGGTAPGGREPSMKVKKKKQKKTSRGK